LQELGIPEERAGDVMLSLDKLEKIGVAGVQEDLRKREVEESQIQAIAAFLQEGRLAASIGSGGRYDQIIGRFLGDGREYRKRRSITRTKSRFHSC